MVKWLRCSTRIHKILCSDFSIINYGMTLDKSLRAKLSPVTHSYHTNASSVSTGVFKIIDPLYLIEKNLSCISTTYLTVYHTCSIDR